ncbi:DNA polymerase V family [Artemisia annua]|uniref:DNA polymerase V family n=1 Tax=Artemisia annua TaxID=35608 RepID=A0A2U1LWU1_ARTAN|nr:DNA polymerase V family [Artemisia annua]
MLCLAHTKHLYTSSGIFFSLTCNNMGRRGSHFIVSVDIYNLKISLLSPRFVDIEEAEDSDEAETGDNTGDGDEQSEDSEGTVVKEPREENSDDSDGGMDNEAMFRMDSYLAQIFRNQAGGGKQQVLKVFSNLCQAFVNPHTTEGSEQLGDHIYKIVEHKILKAKHYPKDIEEAEDSDEAETGDNTDDGDEQSEDSEGTVVKEPREENSDDSDGGMDNEAMFRMDSYLAQIFRNQAGGGDTADSQLVLFKLRVLSLLEIYLHENQGKPQVLKVFSNLCQAFVNPHTTEGSEQLGDHICKIVEHKILKAKHYPKGESLQLSMLEPLLEKNLKLASKPFKKMLEKSISIKFLKTLLMIIEVTMQH